MFCINVYVLNYIVLLFMKLFKIFQNRNLNIKNLEFELSLATFDHIMGFSFPAIPFFLEFF